MVPDGLLPCSQEPATFFCGEGSRSRSYGRTVALRLMVQPCDEYEGNKIRLFSFFQVMEHRWNEIDRETPKYSGKNLSQCHFVHQKSHIDWPGIEPGPSRWKTGDWPNEPWHGQPATRLCLQWYKSIPLASTLFCLRSDEYFSKCIYKGYVGWRGQCMAYLIYWKRTQLFAVSDSVNR
jgi:hypothetical protein